MSKIASKPLQVSVRIQQGPVSSAQKQAWNRFWQKLIAEAKTDVSIHDFLQPQENPHEVQEK